MTPEDQPTLMLPAYGAKAVFNPQGAKKKPLLFLVFAILLPLGLVVASILIMSGQPGRGTATFPSLVGIIHRDGRTATPRPAPSSTPTPVSVPTAGSTPTVVSSPSPVGALPATLKAQIADLEAHGRFFYHGNPGLPEIALTFDDGPNPAYTPQVLAILKKYGVQATFFDLGRLVQLYPDLARQELTDGHTVGNHTWSHPDMPALTPEKIRMQISTTSDAIEQAIGVRPIFFRPPYGDLTAQGLNVINALGLTTIVWNNDARDWSMPGTSMIVTRVLNSVGNGTIILLHDGGGNRLQTVGALPTIIERLRARHFQFVTIARLVADYPSQSAPPAATPTQQPGRNHDSSPAPLGRQRADELLGF